MKIKIGNKSYEAGKITAAQSRRALELNIAALEIATKAADLKTAPNTAGAAALMEIMRNNIDEKAALACDVFGGTFTPEELLAELSSAELNGLINAIGTGN